MQGRPTYSTRTWQTLFVGVWMIVVLTGCGVSHVQTLQGPHDISQYPAIYVTDTALTSKEQNPQAKALNEKFAAFAKDEILRTLRQKGSYRMLTAADNPSGSLKLDTTIYIVYGNRTLRYFVGFGAGSGTIQINMKLHDPATGDVKLEMASASDLAVGGFGGSMDKVVQNSITKIVQEFGNKL